MTNYCDIGEPMYIRAKLAPFGFVDKSLEVGDYIAGDFLVERTTYDDLLKKLAEKRYITQVMNLKALAPKGVKVLWLIEGDMKSAFMNRFGEKWTYSIDRRRRTIAALSSLIAKHGFNMVHSEDSSTTVELLRGISEKRYEESSFDLIETLESPMRGIGPIKFSEVICWFSVWKGIPFTHLTRDEIIGLCDEIIDDKEKMKLMNGIGKKTLTKIRDFYAKEV